jgi:hypothetical protein
MYNDEAPSLDALVARGKREHNKNKSKESCEEARHARLSRKARMEEEMDEDWKEYIDR